jgi:hypothetical protein
MVDTQGHTLTLGFTDSVAAMRRAWGWSHAAPVAVRHRRRSLGPPLVNSSVQPSQATNWLPRRTVRGWWTDGGAKRGDGAMGMADHPARTSRCRGGRSRVVLHSEPEDGALRLWGIMDGNRVCESGAGERRRLSGTGAGGRIGVTGRETHWGSSSSSTHARRRKLIAAMLRISSVN